MKMERQALYDDHSQVRSSFVVWCLCPLSHSDVLSYDCSAGVTYDAPRYAEHTRLLDVKSAKNGKASGTDEQ